MTHRDQHFFANSDRQSVPVHKSEFEVSVIEERTSADSYLTISYDIDSTLHAKIEHHRDTPDIGARAT